MLEERRGRDGGCREEEEGGAQPPIETMHDKMRSCKREEERESQSLGQDKNRGQGT